MNYISDLCLDHNMTQVITRPTQITPEIQAIIEYFFTFSQTLINSSKDIQAIQITSQFI